MGKGSVYLLVAEATTTTTSATTAAAVTIVVTVAVSSTSWIIGGFNHNPAIKTIHGIIEIYLRWCQV